MELKKFAVFSQLSDNVLKNISGIIEEKRIKEGEIIFEEGSVANDFYLVEEGRIEIFKRISSEDVKVLSILLPGDQFGEMSLFEDKPRIASVKALSDVTLLSIKRDNFRKLISSDLDSGMKLLSAIMSATFNRLSATNKQLACLYEIGKTIASSKNLAQMCDRVFKNIRNMCKNCNSGIMAVYNEFTEELDIHAAFGIDPGLTGVAKTDGIYQFIQFKKEILLNNISVEQPELKSGFITGKSLIASAFYFENKFLGFVMLASSEKNSFAINDLILLSSIASLASVSINNISFIAEEEARNRLNEIRQRREF